MARIGPFPQFREPVFIQKKAPNAAIKKDEKVVNTARRAGAEIKSFKKWNDGTNKAASSGTTLNTRKLDDETENFAHERVATELKKAIMQARMDKKLTQTQLAQMINEKPQIVRDYESGKAIPNQQIIGKLERALGTKMPRHRSTPSIGKDPDVSLLSGEKVYHVSLLLNRKVYNVSQLFNSEEFNFFLWLFTENDGLPSYYGSHCSGFKDWGAYPTL
ncbi:Multiprotein-bridging factor 1a [Hibiscus syriacus]|uniref:Multiprotein-bridging factor 1a n=1 Tax=Hibiscus syriacus TaxID=106335 RepID=A0A6A2YW76_HIBSY|nr:multiprotein-bridging factor 1a-like [Hibiscus syriacus]KAE8683754.1 Multiprotein-bridging factor 1a [Hibiscus syriacus]